MIFFSPRYQALDHNGDPLPGAKLHTYLAGTTTTLKNTWSDYLLTTLHQNPVVADSAGYFPGIYLSGNYYFVLNDSTDANIWTQDHVNQISASDISFGNGSITVAQKLGQFFHVADYGAIGDGATDDTTAIKNACQAVQANGGGTLLFDPKTYLIYPTGTFAGSTIIMNTFASCRGVHLDGRGAILTIQDVFATTERLYLFKFDNCAHVTVENFSTVQTKETVIGNAETRGHCPVTVSNSTHNVICRNIDQTGGIIGFVASRVAASEALATSCYEIKISNWNTDFVAYPLSFQYSGNNVDIENCKAINPGRFYFPYGVRGHKLRNCWVVDPLTSPTLHLANYVGIADSAFLENIDVDVSFICAGTTQSDWCALDFESPIAGAGAYPAYIRNINLKLNGVFPAGANQHIMFSIIKKVDGGSYDTQTRGYFVENVTVGGNVRLGQASSTLMNIMSSTNTGTWTTGEFVRNVAVKDLVVTGTSGGSASLVGYNAIVDAIKFENVTLPDGITYDGTAQRGTFYRNSLIGTTYYRDALVESSSASAVVTSGQRTIVELASDVASTASTAFQDVTGLAWTVVSGASYRFKATLMYYTSVATIGIRVSIAIPSVTHSAYHTEVSVGAANGANAAITFENWQTAADSGTTSADSMTTTGGNLCTIEGIIKPSAGGVLQIRFAPETATASGVIIKAGSTLEVW